MKGGVPLKRTKLSDRKMPDYSIAEEITNMVTHIIGGALGVVALISCVIKASIYGGWLDILGAIVFGISMILLYTMSSIYHGLRPGIGKKVLQVLDHCTIYILIAGSYTPIVLSALFPIYPSIAIGLIVVEWSLAALAIVFTAIDWQKYNIFSMICYIGMGWGIVFYCPNVIQTMHQGGFLLLLTGGISYTIGAILYGIGHKHKWFHSVFHVFVVIGSFLHYLAVFIYAL